MEAQLITVVITPLLKKWKKCTLHLMKYIVSHILRHTHTYGN